MLPEVLTQEGKLGIPLEVQKKLGIKAGDRVDVVENDRGEFVLRPKTRSIMELFGALKWDGPPVSIEEMNAVIEEGWATGFKEDGLDDE